MGSNTIDHGLTAADKTVMQGNNNLLTKSMHNQCGRVSVLKYTYLRRMEVNLGSNMIYSCRQKVGTWPW